MNRQLDKTAQTADFFDAYAAGFDALYGTRNTLFNRLINRVFRRSVYLRYQKTISGCSPGGGDGKSALDIGCGPGHYCIALARKRIAEVTGIDFAPAMIELARQKAITARVDDRCHFIQGDFLTHDFDRRFDYTIAMGFFDYVADTREVIDRILSLTTTRAFFSFPVAEGLLAAQRRLRYRTKCPLYTYRREQVENLFADLGDKRCKIEKLHRDYFVTVEL